MRFMERGAWQASPFLFCSIRTQIWVMPIVLLVYLTKQFQCWETGNSHPCHGTEQRIHRADLSADPAAWPPLPLAKGGSGRGGRRNALSYLIPPQGRAFRPSGRGGRLFILFLCILCCHAEQQTDGQSQRWADEPTPSSPGGHKAEGEQMSPPHELLLKPSCSRHPQRAELLMLTGKAFLKCVMCMCTLGL